MSEENVEQGLRQRMNDRYSRKLQTRAAWFLEGGETVRTAVRGVSFLRSRLVILTDRNIYVTKPGAIPALGIAEVIAKHPLGSGQVSSGFGSLTVGNTVIAVFGQHRRTAEIAAAGLSE